MRNSFQYTWALFFAVISLSSCLPESLETKIPQAESKLVVSSQVIPGNFMVITVSKSFSALEGSYGAELDESDIDQFLVKHALVVLSYADRNDTLFTTADAPGVYFSLLRLQKENESFELYVYDSLSKQSVTAHSTMLNRVNLESVAIKTKPAPAIDDTLYQLEYSFNDPEGDNWYVLNVFSKESFQSTFEFGNDRSVYTELISDKLYEDHHINISSEILGYRLPDTAYVMFSNISEEYFRFLDARQRGGSIISSVTGEPINHPTNVQGGYGFFNTHNPSLKQVILTE